MESVEKIISEIVESIRRKELIIFCGAGISCNSGLPIVNQFVPYMLGKLEITKEEEQILMGTSLNNMRIPFEVFIQVTQGNSNVEPIYDIYELGAPNTNHFLLAKLMQAGFINTIVTTNFDRLIEKAMETGEDEDKGKDYDVFYKEEQFRLIDWNNNRQKLIKTHGSIQDRKNMAITIKQVASKELSEQRNCIISQIFSLGRHKSVLILGYSCSDAFDIGLQIQAIKDKCKKVFYLQHIGKDQEPSANQPDKFTANFKGFNAIKLDINTNLFTELLWKELIKEEYELLESKTNWQDNIDIWAKNTTDRSRYNITGVIFYLISEFKTSIKYFEQELKVTDRQTKGSVLNNLGNAYNGLGEHRKAIEYYEEALKISQETGDEQGKGFAFANLGNAYNCLGEHRKAIKYYKQGLKIFQETGDKQGEGNTLIGLGNAYNGLGEHRKAIEYYEEALKISQETGDKQGEENTLIGLGNTYNSLVEYNKAVEYYEQALKISRKAVEFYEQALKISRDMGDEQGEGHTLVGLGNACRILGEHPKAVEFYEQALKILRPMLGNGHLFVKLVERQKSTKHDGEAILKITSWISTKRSISIAGQNLMRFV